MKTLLLKLGYKEKKYSWNDLDPAIQTEVLKKFILSIFAVLFSVVFFISTGNLKEFFILILFSLIYIFMSVHFIMFFEYEKFVLVIGECVKINKPSVTFIGKQIIGQCQMIIKTGDNYVEIPVKYTSKFMTGMELAIYTTDNNINQKSDDYFQILSPLAISIINRKGSFTNHTSLNQKYEENAGGEYDDNLYENVEKEEKEKSD